MTLKKVWNYVTNTEHHQHGWINSRKLNTQCQSKEVLHMNNVDANDSLSFCRIKPKLDELASLHARHLLRSTMDDSCEEEIMTENLSLEISKLMSTTHRHIQHIRSSVNYGHKMEQKLTHNVITYLLLALQELTTKFRNSQNFYLKELNSREERSKVFFDPPDFTTIDLNTESLKPRQIDEVESFDNFLKPKTNNFYTDDTTDEQIDEFFQKPIASRMTQQQLLLFEEENTKTSELREEEVTKIVKSIVDLNDIFKDLSHMVQEQGTVLDRIDYNIENTQIKVTEGFRQLQKADMYQRKNRKMACILILAGVTLTMSLLLIITKF